MTSAGPVQTEREIGRRDIPAGAARSALIRQRYPNPVADVWAACTDPNRINRWFIEPTGDLREGGTFALKGNASGDIVRCQAPTLLALSWVYPGKPDGLAELRLSDEDGGTVLELEHFTVDPGMIVELGIGWEMALDFLGKYLRGELPDRPIPEAEAAEFEPTPEMMKVAQERAEQWSALLKRD
jgi:uncharacterized protein YndB with AHSA1/START domain